MVFQNLSPELREKAKACTSPDELLALAKQQGYKLSEDELNAVSGGSWSSWTCKEDDCLCRGLDRNCWLKE